ncbi:Epn3 [Linum grandiflorum]
MALVQFKKQASFFFKEKIKTARLALTDVTPAQLLTEEATSGDVWPPDTRSMGVISRAAFEVDDYWRIVALVHDRLISCDGASWRVSYKTLVLLEHLLTHGPLRIAQEFERQRHLIRKIGYSFQFVDEKGFNWGLKLRNLSRRVISLIEDGKLLMQERTRLRKLTRGIQGFGSFSNDQNSAPASSSESDDGSSLSHRHSTGNIAPRSTSNDVSSIKMLMRWNSNYDRPQQMYAQLADDEPVDEHDASSLTEEIRPQSWLKI